MTQAALPLPADSAGQQIAAVDQRKIMVPPVGLTRDGDHNYYWRPAEGAEVVGPLPGVTGILKVIDGGGGLIYWAKSTVAKIAVEKLEILANMVEAGGRENAAKWLTGLPDYQRDQAANLGSAVHQYAEQAARGEQVDVAPEAVPFVAAYVNWRERHKPKFIALEQTVVSLKHGYGGTFDAVAEIGGERWLLDYKTSKSVRFETALQLAAYRWADFVGRPGDPRKYKVPPVDRFGVVHIRPEGAELIPYDVTPDTFTAFLSAFGTYRWVKGAAKTIIGKPLGVPS